MQEVFYKSYWVLALTLVLCCLSYLSPHKTLAIYCDGVYVWASTDLSTYCNNNYQFTDIWSLPSNQQAALQKLGKIGIFLGDSSCGNPPCFAPNRPINRWEVAATLARYHILVKHDWTSYDPPNANPADMFVPLKLSDGTTFVDYYWGENGFREAMTAAENRWIRGNSCNGFYPYAGYNASDGTPMVRDSYNGRDFKSTDNCFGPRKDWIFGFHGVFRKGINYWTTDGNGNRTYLTYSNPSTPSNEECWNGCYNFAGGGDSPYYMTRAGFGTLMASYYDQVDHNNYCGTTQSAPFTGSNLINDPTNPSNLICVIHSGQSSCSTPISWASNNIVNDSNSCYYLQATGPGLNSRGNSGSFQSPISTGPTDIKTYTTTYFFQMAGQQASNQMYWASQNFSRILNTLSFSGKNVTGSITSTSCTIPSNQSSCTSTLTWSTSLISNPASVKIKNTATGATIATGSLGGSVGVQIGGGNTSFGVYENVGGTDVLISGATTIATAIQTYSLSGTISIDYSNNSAIDSGDGDGPFTESVTVTLNGPVNTTAQTNASGYYIFNNLPNGSYTVSIPSSINYDSLRPDSTQTNPLPRNINNASAIANFFITPYYSITGGVFEDFNKNGKKDPGENYYTNDTTSFTNSNGGITSPPSKTGTFTISKLLYGQTTVTYASALPGGYVRTYPPAGAGAPSYTVSVGKACAANPITPGLGDGSCQSTGNIINLNFGISNSTPWLQGYGFDMRADNGIKNDVPNTTTTCGTGYTMLPLNPADPNTQGGVFIGNSSAGTSFGVRSTPSSTGWMTDSQYPDTYSPVVPGTIRTSYTYLTSSVKKAGLTPTTLTSLPGCTDPNLACNLTNLASGVYTHTGNVKLGTLAIPANRNIVLLIAGNLDLTGNITVPNTSTLTVAAGENSGTGGNITIASTIGAAPACPPPAGQIQGFFTADHNITVSGTNNCTVNADLMLTIEGALITNASLSGGGFNYYRDLCSGNTNFPGVAIKARPDFIFHAPDLIKQQNYLFREVAP